MKISTARAGRAVGLVLVLAFPVLLAVCGDGDGDAPTSTATQPAQTATPPEAATATVPNATPTASDPGGEAPHAPPVKLAPGVRAVREEVMEQEMVPGAKVGLDPVQLAGNDFPDCGSFVFAFTWQVREPYPAEDTDLQIFTTTMEHEELLAEGPAGKGTVGCSFIELVNNSYVPIVLEMRYAIGVVGE